ncbi:MAG: response regulator [Bacteroidetes bacterium]|nr:response regulator [Bacteroidota bacterium]
MKSILLIEDNDEIRDNMSEILEMSNYKVYLAPDGKEGVALAVQYKPDLIVCDIMMPVLDGYGVIHMLQKNPDTQNIPFIFLTAKAERSEIRKGMDLGADDYITKPFNGTELLNAIEARLRKSDLVKKELPSGMSGFDELVSAAGGADALKNIAQNRSTNTLKKKQVIYSEGGKPYRMYYVESGKVKVYKTNDDGKELVTGLYNAGDFFGYMAMLEGTNYKETAETLEDTELAIIPQEDFEQLINNNKEVMQKFIRLLANNVTDMEQQLLKLAYNSLRKKVADALLIIQSKYSGGKNGFKIDISRENLANIAGTAKESVIRTLSDFKDERLISIEHGDITILDEKKLSNLVN